MKRAAGVRDAQPIQNARYMSFRFIVVGQSLEEIEDHIRLFFLEAVHQYAGITANRELANIVSRFHKILFHFLDGVIDLMLGVGVGVRFGENGLVVQDKYTHSESSCSKSGLGKVASTVKG